jgi:hypothetical protein
MRESTDWSISKTRAVIDRATEAQHTIVSFAVLWRV